jgi:AcrR family transcriptional regulator
MNKTKRKLILSAIELYNESGLVNVLKQDIADKADISLSNFNYHFSTKDKLVYAVCEFITAALDERISENSFIRNSGSGLKIAKIYLEFQEDFKFFYLDTNNILSTYPLLKEGMLKQINISIQIIKNINYLAIGKGQMKPESKDDEGRYDEVAEQIWSGIQFWSAHFQIRGFEGYPVTAGLRFIYNILYPHLTESGRVDYLNFIDEAVEEHEQLLQE